MLTDSGYAARFLRTQTLATLCALAFLAAGCASQNGNSPTSPSGADGAKPPAATSSTTVGFSNFDASTLTVTVGTLTTSTVGQPYIDQGKIHLEILVDATGTPVPCGTVGATWERIDNSGGGLTLSSGQTAHVLDLDNLSSANPAVKNAHCGDTICIRAHYITGGGQTKVDTHFSAPKPFEIVCATTCTLSQGFWKTHYPASWPGNVAANGLNLGTVHYTAAQLESIFNTAPAGNGLIILAHQLIAAKLNIANGADGTAVASAIASADALIGSLVVPPVGSGSLAPGATGALTTTLDNYNKGVTGPGHCVEDDVE